MKLEIKKIGNSTGLILPKELLARLNLAQGDWLYVTEAAGRERPARCPTIPTFEEVHGDCRATSMKTYRNALAELAK